MKFEIVDKQTAYQGFFELDVYTLRHELFAGGWSTEMSREQLVRGRAIAVLLHDPDTDQVLLIEQFRIGAINDPQGPWMLEIVAGIAEDGEQDEAVARREAQEEAGCKVISVEPVAEYYPSAGGCNEVISIYYAPLDLSEVEPGIHGLDAENEDIRTLLISHDEAMTWLKQGKIRSSMTIIALQWLALRKAGY